MGSVSVGIKVVAAAAGMIGGLAALATRDDAFAAPRSPVAVAASGSLCAPAETPLFSCPLGTRQVAVCGTRSGATYRYGRPGRIELASTKVTRAAEAFSGGGETQITATNRGYSYTVFSQTLRTSFGSSDRNDPQSLSGLVVRRAGKTVSVRTCSQDAQVLAHAGGVMPTGRFVPH